MDFWVFARLTSIKSDPEAPGIVALFFAILLE